MPHIHTSVASSSHFQLIVIRALETYEKRTKEDLFAHPLAAQLRACNSPEAILLVLQQQVQVYNWSRRSHERLTHCLDSIVNVLFAFSLTLEEDVSLDASLAKQILTGVGILILAARGFCASYHTIADVFEHIVFFFRRLDLYSEVSPTNEMKNIIAQMLVEVLSILAIATKEIKQCQMKKWLKRLTGKTYIEDTLIALKRLDKLTQEEARMSTSQVLRAILTSIDEDIKVKGSVAEIAYDGKDAEAMQEKVNDEDEAKRSLLPELVGPYDTAYAWEKDESLPFYTAPPAYGTLEIENLLLGHGAVVEIKDNEINESSTTLDDIRDL